MPGAGRPGPTGRRFHPRERGERGVWPGRAQRPSALPAPRRLAAKLSKKFEARGGEAVQSALVRRSGCRSDVGPSPGRAEFRPRLL